MEASSNELKNLEWNEKLQPNKQNKQKIDTSLDVNMMLQRHINYIRIQEFTLNQKQSKIFFFDVCHKAYTFNGEG